MAKMLRIKTCFDCKHSRGGPVIFRCVYKGGQYPLDNYPVIPNSCELDDYAEEGFVRMNNNFWVAPEE